MFNILKVINILFISALLALPLSLSSCSSNKPSFAFKDNLKNKNPSFPSDTQAVIEIPAGTLDKFELNKKSGLIEHEKKNGVLRVVKYLAYPGNYGYIPGSKLSKDKGGDGDPLDVLVLGQAVKRASKLNIKVIGALKLLDKGEQDDKLIAVSENTPFSTISSIKELKKKFPGVTKIIKTWFLNYKGKDKIKSQGYVGKSKANKILEISRKDFLK